MASAGWAWAPPTPTTTHPPPHPAPPACPASRPAAPGGSSRPPQRRLDDLAVEPQMTARRPERLQAPALDPPGDRLGVYAEHDAHLCGRERLSPGCRVHDRMIRRFCETALLVATGLP